MGKVATSSISSAMRKAGLPVHHIHSLDDDHLLKMAKRSISEGRFPAPHICESMAWKERLFSKPELCLYISLVREPIARNLSGFFENARNLLTGHPSEWEPEEVLDVFVKRYKHTIPLDWFDREFEAQLGINIYEQKFDPQEKYVELSRHNTVIFRSDCDDKIAARVLSEALERTIIVGRANDTSNKPYSNIYRAVQRIAKFPKPFIDSMYDTKYVRHFWSDEEINVFRKKWQRPD